MFHRTLREQRCKGRHGESFGPLDRVCVAYCTRRIVLVSICGLKNRKHSVLYRERVAYFAEHWCAINPRVFHDTSRTIAQRRRHDNGSKHIYVYVYRGRTLTIRICTTYNFLSLSLSLPFTTHLILRFLHAGKLY